MTKKNSALVLAAALAAFSLLATSCAQPRLIAQDKHALLIGITDYPGTNNDLQYPVADAELLQTLFVSKGWTVEPLLTDSAATKSGIQSAIATFLSGLSPNATALIYYSGHGTVSNLAAVQYEELHNTLSGFSGDIGDTLLAPYDFNTSTWKGGIPPSEMSSWIDASPTKNVIFISDSCYSGGFVAPADSTDLIASPYTGWGSNTVSVSSLAALGDFGGLLAKNASANGALVPIAISASGNEEFSYEDWPVGNPYNMGINHGIFTYYLNESATRADANGDGYVTCTEAYTYTAKAIKTHWNNVKNSSESFYPHISGSLRDLVLFDNH